MNEHFWESLFGNFAAFFAFRSQFRLKPQLFSSCYWKMCGEYLGNCGDYAVQGNCSSHSGNFAGTPREWLAKGMQRKYDSLQY